MIVCEYCEELKPLFVTLLESHALPVEMADSLAKIGKIVLSEDGKIIGAGFLRQIEGNFALIDGLITNPLMPGKERGEALDFVISGLVEEAKKRDMWKVIGFSSFPSIISRGIERHGFHKMECEFVVHDVWGGK